MRKRSARKGYSLIEMLVALAIGTMIAGGVITLMVAQMQLTSTTNRNIINQENMREVVRFICDEIRLANTFDGSEPIVAADTAAMSFSADIDANGVTDLVEYYMSDSTLMRRYTTTVAGAPFVAEDPILRDVGGISFTYYAIDDVAPANFAEITSVEVELQLDTTANQTALTGMKLTPQLLVGRATIRNKLI